MNEKAIKKFTSAERVFIRYVIMDYQDAIEAKRGGKLEIANYCIYELKGLITGFFLSHSNPRLENWSISLRKRIDNV